MGRTFKRSLDNIFRGHTRLGDQFAVSWNQQDEYYYSGSQRLSALLNIISGGDSVTLVLLDAPELGVKGVAGEIVGKGFDTFADLKKALGSPGEGKAWHHIVEQSQIKKSGFSPAQVHNTINVIPIDEATHAKISGFYSSKPEFAKGKTIRDWLAGQGYEKQYEFGVTVLKDYGVIK